MKPIRQVAGLGMALRPVAARLLDALADAIDQPLRLLAVLDGRVASIDPSRTILDHAQTICCGQPNDALRLLSRVQQ